MKRGQPSGSPFEEEPTALPHLHHRILAGRRKVGSSPSRKVSFAQCNHGFMVPVHGIALKKISKPGRCLTMLLASSSASRMLPKKKICTSLPTHRPVVATSSDLPRDHPRSQQQRGSKAETIVLGHVGGVRCWCGGAVRDTQSGGNCRGRRWSEGRPVGAQGRGVRASKQKVEMG